MKLSLRQLQAFVATARLRSFSRAAHQLGISQPALSKAVGDLEMDVGYALFERTTRRVSLTTAGRQFLPSAERVINAYGSAREDLVSLARGRGGRVSVACLPSIAFGLMPKVLVAFAADHPDIIVDLIEQRADQVADSVRSGEVDLGLSNVVSTQASLQTSPLLEDRFDLVCPVGHPLARRKSVRWRELDGVPIIAMTPDSGIWQEIEIALHGVGLTLAIRYIASNPGTILSLAAAGVGVSPLPGLAWPRPGDPSLVHRPLIEPRVQRQLLILRRVGESMGPAVRLLMPYIHSASRSMARAS